MHDRSALGAADVSDERLRLMVADLLRVDPDLTVLARSSAEEVAYDLPAITTAGRYWVRGVAEVDGAERAFTMFVKHVQSWARSPLFAAVPEEAREFAEATVPWRTEALAYRSDLGDRLPEGLTMPRAVGVFDLDAKSVALWLEAVETQELVWDDHRYAEAARLLGRLAASPSVRERARVGGSEWSVLTYVHGRLDMHVVPMLRTRPSGSTRWSPAPSATCCASGCWRPRTVLPRSLRS
jgi:hypothetical protein